MGFASNKLRQKNPKNRKNKINLVFDEDKRREFLTGFRKRKLQRQQRAKEKFEKQLKEERKRLKSDARESYKKLVVSHRTIPELESLLAEEYDDDEVNVKVTELSASDIAEQNHWIGPNMPKYESNENQEENDATTSNSEDDDVPGMELKQKTVKKQAKPTVAQYTSQREVKQVLKKQAVKNVKKSKIFQKKNRIEQSKQKKKSTIKKRERIKLQNKTNKRKGFNKQNKQM